MFTCYLFSPIIVLYDVGQKVFMRELIMNELERIEELVRVHKKKKHRRIAAFSGIAAVCILIIVGIIYFTKDESTPAQGQAVASKETAVTPDSASDTTSDDQKNRQAETSLPEEIELTVSMMGDCTLGMDQSFGFDTSLNAYYLYQGADYFFGNVKSILEADNLSIVNMEGTLTEDGTRQDKQYAFKGDPKFASILTEGSVEAANLANNHSHDYGDDSYTDTISALEDAGITTFGYDEVAVMEINGIKVGLVGIYELADHLKRQQQLEDNIAKVKSQGADLIIVSFHWGNERETIPDYHQMTLGHAAIDLGADLVVGHHPHVLQGIEKYRDKYIAYSLGNFCFGGNNFPSDMDTIIFQQTFTFRNGELVLDDNTNIIPCRLSSEQGFNNYQPTPAQGEEADRILEKLDELTNQIYSQRL